MGGRIIFSHGTSNSKGTAILLKCRTKLKINFQISDSNDRCVILQCTCTINDQKYILANVHGPNADNPTFYHKVVEDIDSLNTDLKIIGGDFNLVLDPIVDRQGSDTNFKASHEFFYVIYS